METLAGLDNPVVQSADTNLGCESPRTRALSVLTLALVACLAVFHGWRPGFVFVPTDALRLVAPWADSNQHYIARNEALLDQTVQFVPWTIYAVQRLRNGEIPLWNPYSQLGVPFIGNGQSAVFYPTMLLHVLLSPTWSWTIAAALKLFLAGLGVWLLAGRYGLRGAPRLLPAIAFMLCGFNVVWLNHPHANVSALLPWAVLITEMIVQRVTLGRILAAALIFALQFLGGHPGTIIHLLLTAALVWAIRAVMAAERRRVAIRSAIALAAALVLGFALAAMQWLPLLEYAAHSGATVVRKERLAAQPFISTDPRYLIGIVFPYANGFPDGVTPFEIRRATKLPSTTELAPGWVGTIPLVLGVYAAIALRRRATVKMWLIIGLIAAAIAIQFPLLDNIVRRIPGLGAVQNARLLLTAALALSILAGFGLDDLIQRLRCGNDPVWLRKLMRRLAYIAIAMAILGATALAAGRQKILKLGHAKAEAEYNKTDVHEHTLPEVLEVVNRIHKELVLTSLRLLIPAAMLGIGALLLSRARRKGPDGAEATVAWGLLALALIDLLAFAIPFNPGAPKETYFPRTAAIEKLKSLPEARISGTFRTLFPETATAYGLCDLRGYDALAPLRYLKWWEHEEIGQLPRDAHGYLLQLRNPEHPPWELLNFGYIISGPNQPAPSPEKFEEISRGEDAVIYRARQARRRAWAVWEVEKYETIQEVLDRVGQMDFDPNRVVLVDREINDGVSSLLHLLPDRNRKLLEKHWHDYPERVSAAAPPREPRIIAVLEQREPEVVHIFVGRGGGWLVLADSYFPGWTARIVGEVDALPIFPAYGVMRAVPLPPRTSPYMVRFAYWPMSWRVGVKISLAAWTLFLVLATAMLARTALRRGSARS